MNINLFDYYLPEELIAQRPSEKRDHSRLLAVNRETHTYEDKHFYDILDYLKLGDVLVRNNTKVIPARLLGIKEKTGAHCELLLLIFPSHSKAWKNPAACLGRSSQIRPLLFQKNNGSCQCFSVLPALLERQPLRLIVFIG